MNEEPPKFSDVLGLDDTANPFSQGWLRTEHEKQGNRHDRRAERAKQRKLLKQVKRMQARMKADKPGI